MSPNLALIYLSDLPVVFRGSWKLNLYKLCRFWIVRFTKTLEVEDKLSTIM